ncbi:MAG: hypothetical protein HOQ32_01635, partial [Lysobacter sp.]|nr:hypothetical protein [Lysobacter sp.]
MTPKPPPARWSLSRMRLAPRIAIVVLSTMAMTLLIDIAIGMALRSTGPTLVDEQSLVQQALDVRAMIAGLPPAQRAAAAEDATQRRKLEFDLLPPSDDRHGPPLSGLIESMRKRLVETPDTSGGAYAVSMNVLPDAQGRGVRQVTVVVPRLGAARGEILSVAARPALGMVTISALPSQGMIAPAPAPTLPAEAVVGVPASDETADFARTELAAQDASELQPRMPELPGQTWGETANARPRML